MACSSPAAALLKSPPTALQLLLEEINFQRTKEMRQLLKDGKKPVGFFFLLKIWPTGKSMMAGGYRFFTIWTFLRVRGVGG